MSLPFIVEPSELAGLLAQPTAQKLLILDIGSSAQYRAGHIDTAVHLPPEKIIDGTGNTPGKIASAERLSRVFSFLGLTPDTQVVVYDDEGGAWAGRLIWTLAAIGHQQVSYLNGGLHAWADSGLPLTTAIPSVTPEPFTARIDPDVVIELADVQNSFDRAATVIWDARSPAEFDGSRRTTARNGHMPGAVNCEWSQLLDFNNSYRIRKDARERLAALGITAERHIITHCHSHHRSGFSYLVGRALGLSIRAYHGGWAEWGAAPHTAIVDPQARIETANAS